MVGRSEFLKYIKRSLHAKCDRSVCEMTVSLIVVNNHDKWVIVRGPSTVCATA